MLVLIIGLALFLGAHSIRIAAPDWRDRQKARLGGGPWRGAYSLVSLIGLALVIWGYGLARPTAPAVYAPPEWLRHVTFFLMALSFICLAAYVFPAGRIKPALKHPLLAAVKIWAVAHLLANGDLASILLFGGFLVWAVADRIALKRRGQPAPVAGPAAWDVAAIASAVVLYALFVWRLHLWLIGVAPIG